MGRFAEFFRRKEPEIDPKALEMLESRIKALEDTRASDAFDLENLYDKASRAVARLRARSAALEKRENEEGNGEIEPDAMQQVRERFARLRPQ